ncbi:ornithine cyclodeaminase family protein [Oscillatoria sp. FACHB-1407]|uniref:ornithine cyclodeaminase family protein n=1 Tax=Oscillatoria sp. FACHB-1407 TaxID=2692847 RepID=UPI001683069F|nr:ornithine cyclodeaminase family protein [Oscillatoria sp. FACHB-1407]MBD2463155.1 ornithine cyclodeaminase family protein [Oscillatoria sp. FACHB-1407]
MTKIIELSTIKQILETLDPVSLIEDGFVAYSQGKAVVPPVGELLFDHPPGDVHIKYGYLIGDDYYVIKVASGFYENVDQGLPANSGLMLLFDQKTGTLKSILLDEGYLTNVRTAMAGAIAAKYLAPRQVEAIGVLGTGIQARMQVQYLQPHISCRNIVVWGRTPSRLDAYKADMEMRGYVVRTTSDPAEVAALCHLIITTTPSSQPLLSAAQIRPGTHITAMGSDTPEKNELAPDVLQKADQVVVDSLSQCRERGELHHALAAGVIDETQVVELGQVIVDPTLHRNSDTQITVVDLTGVAVQDIQIAKAVFQAAMGHS